MTFGESLRALRRAASITQRALAEKVGLDFSYISKLENDRNPPPAAETIVKICKVLNSPPDALLALKGELPPDVHSAIGANQAVLEFLRETQKLDLTDNDWRKLGLEARKLRGRQN